MNVTESIHIDASPDVVWAVTCDVERWPEWTPTVTSARLVGDRDFGVGSVAMLEQPMQPRSEWVVTEFRAGERFAWETHRTGLRMVAAHEMTPDGAGTRNVLSVDAMAAQITSASATSQCSSARRASWFTWTHGEPSNAEEHHSHRRAHPGLGVIRCCAGTELRACTRSDRP